MGASMFTPASAPLGPGKERRRGLLTTLVVTVAAVLLGISGAGVTSALLTSTATQPGATITAGTGSIRIDGASTGVLGTRGLSPATPAAWAFTVTNTGDAPMTLAGTIATAAGAPVYGNAAQALLVPVANAAACTPAVSGTAAALNGYANPAMGAVAVGQTSWYCLVVSLPMGTSAAGSGSPLSFTLTVNATQSPS